MIVLKPNSKQQIKIVLTWLPKAVAGSLTRISAGMAGVWGLNASNQVIDHYCCHHHDIVVVVIIITIIIITISTGAYWWSAVKQFIKKTSAIMGFRIASGKSSSRFSSFIICNFDQCSHCFMICITMHDQRHQFDHHDYISCDHHDCNYCDGHSCNCCNQHH